ncbi:MAG: DNA-3-methyladenine glycosylase 2 family protein [Acidimicrobiales bacterium]|nr:DNA-3-methyladenine glycosylase 2 family protein [Acidimicrobiales bacterium]
MIEDPDRCYAAVASRDARFDGFFTTGVTSTGIYCRPSCPAVTPKRSNVRFFASPAAAHAAGFRACRRCLPDAAPGSPEWNRRADVVGRAMRLITDGTVDREGVEGIGRRLGYSTRQINRLLVAEVGAGPLAMARAQRAQSARVLIETTEMEFGEVAFAAGFGSIRQFNATVREVFARTPGELRAARRGSTSSSDGESPMLGALRLRLAHRAPFASGELLSFLADRTIVGMEEVVRDEAGVPTSYRRTLDLPHGPAIVSLTPEPPRGTDSRGGDRAQRTNAVTCDLRLTDNRDLATAVARCRRLLDLDADPVAVDAHLATDPLLLSAVAARPGLRVPGCVDGFEIAVRAVVGQQVSVAGAVTTIGRMVQEHGIDVSALDGTLCRLFPRPAVLAEVDPASLPMPRRRAEALVDLAGKVADGTILLDVGSDWQRTRRQLLDIAGIGPWTVEDIALRGLGDPDAFPASDLGVRRALTEHGLARVPEIEAHAEAWRPWRAYATIHLWSSS